MRGYSFPLKSLTFASVLLVGSLSASAQSAYFQAMTNLNPIMYFPLQETNQPPIADVETNYGSLGSSANAIYSGHNMAKGFGGATGDGDTAVSDSDGWGGFCAVPTTDPRTAVNSPTFTVEVWVNSAENARGFEGIVAKSGANSGGINGSNNQGGWCLSQNYLAYLDSSDLRGFDFHVYNGVGHGGAEVIVPFQVVNNTWYHLVATYDGTNCWLYINGVNMIAKGDGQQIPMTGAYVPDTWNILQIGSSRGLNGNNYHGLIDDVAIYTNVLSANDISNHYYAAAVAPTSTSYTNAVFADHPYMYWRMDSPGYDANANGPSFYPIATNYGALPNSFGAMYGTASQPGVLGPQFSGMLDPNNGNASYGVAINGIGGNNGDTLNVPIGYTNSTAQFAPDAAPIIVTNIFGDPNAYLLNPTNGTGNRVPFSFTVWFKANPHDWNRFQTICGHSDTGWRVSMNTTGIIQWNPGPGGEVGTALSYDDGNWHQFVGTYDGTNVLTYVDGALVVATTTTGTGVGTPLYPILGGDRYYLDSGNAFAYGNGGTANTTYRNRDFSGSIAHFAFFTNVLSPGQVETLFSAAVTNQAPFIVGQPATGRVNPKPPTFLFFGVAAVGSGPLSYQWYFNSVSNYSGATQLVDDGVKYVGSTTTQVTVSNLVASDSGYYYVIVTNDLGSVTSRLASLSVNYTPLITAQTPAANFSLFPGQITTVSVSTTSDTNGSVGALSFYWFTNNVFDGATASSFTLGPVSAANNGETFYCVVSNADGTATSAPVTLTVQPFPAGLTNSAFSSNILALAPTAYWPMHDSGQTPAPPSLETNYGTLGQIASGYWDDWRQPVNFLAGNLLNGGITNDLTVWHDFPSAIAGDSDGAVELSGINRSYVVIPRIPPPSPGTSPSSYTISAPFTLEAWVKPYNDLNFGIMLSTDQGTINGGSQRGGFNWGYYTNTPNTFGITIYDGNGGDSITNMTSANYPPGYWYHVATTYDGTNVQFYINGVADPMTGGSGTLATNLPNTWDPITIGCGRGLNANLFWGGMDEIAIYTNILSVAEIQKHYNDGTNANYHTYTNDVLENSPLLYYRMDSPTWQAPQIATWPVLTNYGKLGLNGIYTPGAIPGGGPGPSVDGAPVGGLAASNSLQANGCSIFADALNNAAYHPPSFVSRTPLSAAAWVKGDPANTGSQNWQGFVAQGDGAYRLNMNSGNPRANFNPGGAGGDSGNSTTTGTSANINDGNWHYVVGTYDGTNTVLWVDGLVSASNSSTANIQSTNAETFIGAYPANSVPSSTPNSLSGEIGRVFAGSICEAAYWNGTALKASQVQALYSSLQIAPIIARQPISASANERAFFTNSVFASGSPPFTYQWYKDGLPMPVAGQTNLPFGGTNASLILNTVVPSDQDTNYFVVVANAFGSATSAVWALNPVFTLPHITNDIVTTNMTLFPGGHALFAISTIGAQPITYQWYSNSVAIAGATASSYNLLNAQPPSSVQDYYCIASNFLGTTTSLVAQVTVLASPAASYPMTIIGDNPIGFWRLNEGPDNGAGNDGVTAFDYFGGNNGFYTNTELSQTAPPGVYNPNCEPTVLAAYFGILATSNCMVHSIPTNVDFASTTNAEFSIECWANGFGQGGDNGIVDKGTAGGGEEFALDTGSANHGFRFYLRGTNGTAYNVTTTNLPDGNWHHLVAVCDEANGEAWLFIDGLVAGSNTVPVGIGIQGSAVPMQFGARPTNNAAVDNLQFVGYMNDVSAYSYALSYSQVLNHYFAACIPARFVTQPTNYTTGQNGTAFFSASVIGTPAISNQWFTGGNPGSPGTSGTGTPIIGATNTTLVLNNVQPVNGTSYYLETVNAYGTNDSTQVFLTVVSGAPQISQNVPASLLVPEGATISIPVIAYGDEPLTYQWLKGDTNGQNFANLSATPRITGTQSNVLSINNAQPSDTGTYEVGIANDAGSVTSSIASLVVGPVPIGFYGSGQGWMVQSNSGGAWAGGSPYNNNILTLTDGGGSEARATFFQFKQYMGAFKASFVYQATGSGTLADGVTFCLQNDSRGAAALGGSGGSLGVSGITPSWEFEINIYPPNTVGFSINTNGAIGPNTVPGSVNFSSGDPIQVTLLYAQNQMALTFTDLVAATTFSTTISIPAGMPQVLGGQQTAYIGFTGATGGSQATQTVTDFKFIGIPTAAIAHTPPGFATVTWTGLIGGYVLMQSPNLGAPNWTPVTNADTVINSNHTVVVPTPGGTNLFYRLSVPF